MHQFLDVLSSQVLPFVQSGQSRIIAHSPTDFSEIFEPHAFFETYPHDRKRHTYYEWMRLLSGQAQMKINGQM